MRELIYPACLLFARVAVFLALTCCLLTQWREMRIDAGGFMLQASRDGLSIHRTGWPGNFRVRVSQAHRQPSSGYHRNEQPGGPLILSDRPLNVNSSSPIRGVNVLIVENMGIWSFAIRHWLLVAVSAFTLCGLYVLRAWQWRNAKKRQGQINRPCP